MLGLHWAEFSNTDYYHTTAGNARQPRMFRVMQASHPRDRTIIGSLWRIPQGRPQWQNAEELHGNPPTITYPKAVNLKETKTTRLYIMPRSDEGTTTSDYDLLYEDLSTGQFLYDQTASNSNATCCRTSEAHRANTP
jgi:hypothetical protein